MKTSLILFTALLSSILFHAQTIELPETLISLNYKYLETQKSQSVTQHVKALESEVLNFNHKEELSELYDDEYDTYSVSFHVPKGKIVAAYDRNGKIIRTIEKYNNVRLPSVVMQAVSARFPNWQIVEDVYFIKYHNEKDSLLKQYKIKIKNEDEIITIKTNEKGAFM